MSTTPPSTPTPSTAKALLSSLQAAGGYVAIAVQVGEVVVPLVKGLIMSIKGIASGQQTVSYQVLVQADGTELDQIVQLATEDLQAINAELVRQGKAPLVIPPTT